MKIVICATAFAGAVFAGEVNLRTAAVTDGAGNLVALSDGSDVWAAGREADKDFDGSVSGNDFYDPKHAARDTWTGYEVTSPRILTRIRYYGRDFNAATSLKHLNASVIQGANTADFSDAVTLHSFVPPRGYVGGSWVEEFVKPTAQAFRYFRVLERYSIAQANTFAGALRELEFYGVETAAEVAEIEAAAAAGVAEVVPTDVAVEPLDFTNQYPVISASVARPYTGLIVLRAPGAGGPWTDIAVIDRDTQAYTDSSAAIGVPCYYRVVAAYTDSNGVRTIGRTNETAVYYRRQNLLERNWSDMTQLKDDVNVIVKGGTGWQFNDATIEDNARRAFDDIIGKYSQGPNFYPGAPRTCIGVDFGGDPCYVTSMRLNFQYDNDKNRLNGVVLAGSNETEWYSDGNFTNLTLPLSYSGTGWYAPVCTVTNEPYRYVFCHNPSYNDWAGQAAELQLYGWPVSATANAAVGARDVAVSHAVSPTLVISWSGDFCTTCTYDVERSTDGGTWQTVASGLAAGTTTWTDAAAPYDGSRYAYRVVSRNGEGVAYSDTVESRPYSPGNGTGLHCEWWTNFVTTTGGEALARVSTNATLDFASVDVGGEKANIFARFSGRLIAPYAGDYTFDVEAGGTAVLWIDGKPVVYPDVSRGALALAAGEHELTATWFKNSADSTFRLCWGGCIAHEIIPASQFIPDPPRTLPAGWTGCRPFGVNANISNPANVRMNADGTLDFAYGGPDLSWGNNGYGFMWQPVKGDFTLTAKITSLAWDNSWWGTKAGLMVRSALDASAMMRVYGMKRSGGTLYIVGRHKTGETGEFIRDVSLIDGKDGSTINFSPAPVWFRLKRTGNVFSFFYRKSTSAAWIKIFEETDSAGEYGATAYVGLAAFGEGAGLGDLAVPYYRWNFADVSLRTPSSFVLRLR